MHKEKTPCRCGLISTYILSNHRVTDSTKNKIRKNDSLIVSADFVFGIIFLGIAKNRILI
jgi:hypothetical protein